MTRQTENLDLTDYLCFSLSSCLLLHIRSDLAEVLHWGREQADICVEVFQGGLVRSLNLSISLNKIGIMNVTVNKKSIHDRVQLW